MAARMPSRWRAQGAGEPDERPEAGARGPGQPGVEVRGRERAGRRGGRAAGALRAAGRRGRAGVLACWTSPSVASWPMVWCSGALSSDQRVPLTQRPVGVCERSWAFHSSRRTWSVARAAEAARRGRGQSRSRRRGTAARIARWYSPLMSIETARIECRRSPSSSKKRLQGGAVAARRAPHDRARGVVGDRGQVALIAAVADLVDADRDQAVEAALVEVVGDDALRRSARPCPSRSAAARRSASWPSAAPATPRRPRSRACAARPAAPTAPAPAARRSRGSAAGAARTRSRSGWRRDRGGASA